MLKRIFLCIFTVVLAVMTNAAYCQAGTDLYWQLSIRPGASAHCQQTATPCVWESDAPEVAQVSPDGVITAVHEGFATLTALLPDGSMAQCDVTVDESAMPALIRQAIDFALSEWESNLGNGFSRSNKYTKWYCGKPCSFGWCGAFIGYCFDRVGIGMKYWADSSPVADGSPYAVREAGVGKLLKGYTRMQRTGEIPHPGYLVIYGVSGGSSSVIHVGLVTDVEETAGGLYRVQTVEGNVSNRIKRYCYLYDSTIKGPAVNMLALPADEQTDNRFYYDLHESNWYINVFCQTWF
jgi:hypothetical protein